jgi:ubiquinone/menaquinone biosynthesis C-methylase UbiE
VTPPRPTFDRLAPLYHALERLSYGGILHWCRTAHLHRLAARRKALILGDGDGRFLADFLRANAFARVDSLDISPAMVRLARQRISAIPGAAGRVRFVTGDARAVALPDAGYDLVVTNFFLDCFPADQLAALIDRLTAACDRDAVWVDGDFRQPPRGWPRLAARSLLAGMYAFFRLTTRIPARRLVDPAPLLVARGFDLESEVTRLRGFLSSRLWVRTPSG